MMWCELYLRGSEWRTRKGKRAPDQALDCEVGVELAVDVALDVDLDLEVDVDFDFEMDVPPLWVVHAPRATLWWGGADREYQYPC